MDKDEILNRFQTFTVCWWMGLALCGGIAAWYLGLQGMPPMFYAIYAIIGAAVLVVAAETLMFVILYKAWAQIQHPGVRRSPAAAVLPLLIPIFHYIWHFVCYVGLSRELNARLKRDQITGNRVNTGLAQTLCWSPLIYALIWEGVQGLPQWQFIAGTLMLISSVVLPYLVIYQIFRACYAIAEQAEKPIYVPLSEPDGATPA